MKIHVKIHSKINETGSPKIHKTGQDRDDFTGNFTSYIKINIKIILKIHSKMDRKIKDFDKDRDNIISDFSNKKKR